MTAASRPARPAAAAWTVYVDGAARGNPGPAAAGIQILDPSGRCVRRIGRNLGVLPNNQAEYRALLIALRELGAYKPSAAIVRMDSELVIRQLTGRYRVRDPVLHDLFARVQAELAPLPPIKFEHVLRARNAGADRLANLALDGAPVDERVDRG